MPRISEPTHGSDMGNKNVDPLLNKTSRSYTSQGGDLSKFGREGGTALVRYNQERAEHQGLRVGAPHCCLGQEPWEILLL